jgi:hypothetical protein
MEEFILDRDAKRPVRFHGTRLLENSGHWINGKDQNRYYVLTLYKHEDGRYILSWEYTSHWQGETSHARVEPFDSVEAAMQALEEFDPLVWLIGYRPILARHPEYCRDDTQTGYSQRQADLEAQLTGHYHQQVAEIARALDLVEDL